jgi:hypothetical protein
MQSWHDTILYILGRGIFFEFSFLKLPLSGYFLQVQSKVVFFLNLKIRLQVVINCLCLINLFENVVGWIRATRSCLETS